MPDLELRRKTLEAAGWTQIRSCQNEHGRLELRGISPNGEPRVLRPCPAVESDTGLAITMLQDWHKKTAESYIEIFILESVTRIHLVWDSIHRRQWADGEHESLATAACLAICAAAEAVKS